MAEQKPIGNLLYTKEADASLEKTKAELQVPDPVQERAYGILTGQEPSKDTEETNESKSN